MDLVNSAGSQEPRKTQDLNGRKQANAARQPANDVRPQEQGKSINGLIQEEIIPRLLLVHSAERRSPQFFEGRRARPSEADHFATLPLQCEADELLIEIDRLRASGISTESVLIDVLARSAQRLGKMWEDDDCDFIDVTVGLWRLHEVMRECTRSSESQFDSKDAQNFALFTPMPGEQHNFGTLMVEEVFSNAGWQTEVLLEPQRHELIHLLAERPFDLVGLTVSCDCPSAMLSDLINAIRSVSKNSNVRVIIGGNQINSDPSLALGAGADGTAPDARSALALAERIVAGSGPVTLPVP